MIPARARAVAAPVARTLRRLDHAAGRLGSRRTVLVEGRTPMNLAVLAPIIRELEGDRRVIVRYTGAQREDLRRALCEMGVASRTITRERAAWSRIDLYMNADPWEAATLHRVRRQINFFHGVAGKYDLDCPRELPLDFTRYHRIAFPNQERLKRYVDAGIVAADRAALVGFPKADALATARVSPAAAASALGLDGDRQTIIYAPTFSPASSLHSHGETIVEALLGAGWNVIAKLHDRSFDTDAKYTDGIDWRSRLSRFASSRRFLLADRGDSTPYLLASSVMVTDHSSVGFEFFVLDRPLVVFDAPDLATSARINPAKVALLRSAAAVVTTIRDLDAAVRAELHAPARRAAARRHAANKVFYDPGQATSRAVALVYDLLGLSPCAISQQSDAGRIAAPFDSGRVA